MDWRKEYDEGYAALRKQTKEGAAFSVCVIPVSAIQNLIEDGNKGNKTAKQIANSLNAGSKWQRGGDGEHVA